MSVQLNYIPAFGFEHSGCNAINYRMSKMSGDHGKELLATIRSWAENFFKVAAIVMPLVGVGRIIHTLVYCEDEDKALKCFRGVMETFGFGFLMVGIDIGVTLWRSLKPAIIS